MSANLSALELLSQGDEARQKPFLNKFWPEIIGVCFGIGTGVIINFGTRRPLWSGIQKHVLGVAGWVAALSYVQRKRDDYLAEKDAVIRHYVELHPETFQTSERKKIGDILEPWIPIR